MVALADIQKLIPNYQNDILIKLSGGIKEGIIRINTACKEFGENVKGLRPADGTLMSARVVFEIAPSDDEVEMFALKYTVELFRNCELPQPPENLAIYSMVDKDGKRVPPTKEYEEHLMEKLKRGDYDF